jgi:hypothetical protein
MSEQEKAEAWKMPEIGAESPASNARCVNSYRALNITLMQAQYGLGLHRGFRLRDHLTFL